MIRARPTFAAEVAQLRRHTTVRDGTRWRIGFTDGRTVSAQVRTVTLHRAGDLRAAARSPQPGLLRHVNDQVAAASAPSASRTSSSWVLGEALGITWRTTPSSSMRKVARWAPQ
jgi:hypothetical protein